MSKISFRVDSIKLEESALKNINARNLIGLKLIHEHQAISDEYIVSDSNCLQSIDYEFFIDDYFGELDKIVLLIRSVQSCFFKFGNSQKEVITERVDENCDNNIKKENIEKKQSNSNIIGFCTVDMTKMHPGSNNTFTSELFSKSQNKVIGHADLEIYIKNTSSKVNNEKKVHQISKDTVISKDTIKPRKITQPFVL